MKRKIIYLAGIAAVLLWGCGCSEPELPAGTLLNQAVDKATDGNWQEADQLAKRALKGNPENADALLLRALASNSLNARSEAVDYAIQAARLKPDSFAAQYIQGMLLSLSGKPDLALKALKEAIRLRPDNVSTLILLTENSLAVRRYQDAARYLKILARNRNYARSSYVWNGLGTCYAETAPEMAQRYFRMAETLIPNLPITTLNQAVLHDVKLSQSRAACAAWMQRTGRSQEDYRKECAQTARQYYEQFIRMTAGKAEYDTLRQQAELRLGFMKGR